MELYGHIYMHPSNFLILIEKNIALILTLTNNIILLLSLTFLKKLI